MNLTAVRTTLRRALAATVSATGPRPRLTRAMWTFDTIVAGLLAVYGLFYTLSGSQPSVLLGIEHIPGMDRATVVVRLVPVVHLARRITFGLLASMPLVLRRRYPLATFLLVLGATVAMGDSDGPRVALLTTLIGAYSAARYSPYRVPALASMLLAAGLVTRYLADGLPDIPNTLTSFAILVPLGLAANAIRLGRQRADETRERMRAMEHEQEESMRRAVEHERSRIARELHDVVTHNVSVMVVQAGAARKIMDAAPDQARAALLAVEASGRSAMAELRQVMGLLTPAHQADGDGSDGEDDAELAPQPGIDHLPTLVGRVRETGMPVEFTVTGQARPLPPGVDLAAYRVVQEALTNTMKHAAGASATIAVDYGPDRLRITVADAGGRPGSAATTGNGRGLIGLRERLAVYRGELEAGGDEDGGYRVRAVIPLEDR